MTGNLFQQSPFFYFSKTGRSAYFSDWQISIERTLTNDSVFRATYHGVVGNKLISRQQSQNQLDPRYWAIYGSLLGNTISSVLNNPVVVAAGSTALPHLPHKPPTTASATSVPTVFRNRQQCQRPERRSFDVPRAGDQLRAPVRQGSLPYVHLHILQLISTSNGEDANRDTLGAVQNQYNRRLDKSVAYNEDTPHNFHIGYSYDLPIG